MSADGRDVDGADLALGLRVAVMRLRRRLATEHVRDNHLSLGAMAVLAALHHRGEQTLGLLAARECVRPPTMTRLVNALEAGGYVVRRVGEDDRRSVNVALTDLGRATMMADQVRRDEWLAERLVALAPAEVDLLRAALPILDRLGGAARRSA